MTLERLPWSSRCARALQVVPAGGAGRPRALAALLVVLCAAPSVAHARVVFGTDKNTGFMQAATISGGSIGTPASFPASGSTGDHIALVSQASAAIMLQNSQYPAYVYATSINRKLLYYPRTGPNPGDVSTTPTTIDGSTPVTGDVRPMAAGDVTGDGLTDLLVAFQGSGSTDTAKLNVYLYTQQSNGSFTRSTIATGVGTVTNFPSGITSMALADSNADGRLDLILLAPTTTSNADQIWVFTNTGTSTPFDSSHKASIAGTHALIGTGTMWGSLAVGFYNNDSIPDIMAIGNNQKLYRMSGNGNGTFATPVLLQTFSSISFGSHVMAAADLDDGKWDILLANAYSSADKSLYWFRGDGAGGIAATPSQTITGWGTNVAVELTACTYKASGASCANDTVCDGAETCSAGVCNAGTPLNCDDSNVCTNDSCDAVSGCQHAAGNAGTVCRESEGECDVAETCTGSSATCPSDGRKASGTACTDDGNVCTADQCDGTSVTCQHPAGNYGVECRASTGECDPAETCDGVSLDCPNNRFKDSTETCGSAADLCEIQAFCQGSSGICPGALPRDGSYTCRAAGGPCDIAEHCTGVSYACPQDSVQPAATACPDDGTICTTDQCDGSGNCAHTANPTLVNWTCEEDGNPSTVDHCITSGTCLHANLDPTAVVLFSEQNHGGQQSLPLGPGAYPHSPDTGFPDNATHSIILGAGAYAILCVDAEYKGGCDPIEASLNSLPRTGITSIVVTAQTCTPTADEIAVYWDVNFTGPCKVFHPDDTGSTTFDGGLAMGFPENSISSLAVGANVQAVLCTKRAMEGTCETFGASVANLGATSVNSDNTVSLLVQKRLAPLDLGASIYVGRTSLDENIPTDLDKDGLDDRLEGNLGEQFAPIAVFDAEEPARRDTPVREPILAFQVRPRGCVGLACASEQGLLPGCSGGACPGTKRINLTYEFLFTKDGGYTTGNVCDNTDGHWGDDDAVFLVVESNDSGRSWTLVNVSTRSEYHWPGDTGSGKREDTWLEHVDNHPLIFNSSGKHHLYLHAGDHDNSPYSHPPFPFDITDNSQCPDDNDGDGAIIWPDVYQLGIVDAAGTHWPNNVGERLVQRLSETRVDRFAGDLHSFFPLHGPADPVAPAGLPTLCPQGPCGGTPPPDPLDPICTSPAICDRFWACTDYCSGCPGDGLDVWSPDAFCAIDRDKCSPVSAWWHSDPIVFCTALGSDPSCPMMDPRRVAKVFVDDQYAGLGSQLTIGAYGHSTDIGLPADSISSVQVGADVMAIMCRDADYAGSCAVFGGDTSSLAGTDVGNDAVSSVIVTPRSCTPGFNEVAIFWDTNYGPPCVVLPTGLYESGGVLGFPENQISSVKVGTGARVLMCSRSNFTGTCDLITDDIPDMAATGVGNDNVVSVTVDLKP